MSDELTSCEIAAPIAAALAAMAKGEPLRLTKLSTKGGCSAKWSPAQLQEILSHITPHDPDPNLLQGFSSSDDAAVYKLTDDIAVVLTTDFFTPVVDDPYDFGRVAAANAISDVYAMGAKPVVALNLMAFPSTLGPDVAGEVVRGGADKAWEAGTLVVGGHTIEDDEPKYGLAVMGVVHPDRIVRNYGAKPGDALYLTKTLGTGVMAAAHKIGLVSDEDMAPVVEGMAELNRAAGEAMVEAGVNAGTDVTGFGLAGHLLEMLDASGVSAKIDYKALPLFPQVEQLVDDYCRPGRLFQIMDHVEGHLQVRCDDPVRADNMAAVVCDPQTSGGMLVSVPAENAPVFEQAFARLAHRKPWRIGHITADPTAQIVVE